jgi:hypothetical protein
VVERARGGRNVNFVFSRSFRTHSLSLSFCLALFVSLSLSMDDESLFDVEECVYWRAPCVCAL